MPSAQVLAIEWGNGAGDISPGEHAPHFLAGRDPRGVLRFGQPPEPLRCLVQGPGHDRVVDVLEPVQPSHHGLVRLEHRDGARILPVVLEGHDELAEHRRGVRCQLQRTCQRPDRQVAEAVVNARVAEGVEQPRVLGAGAVPASATAAAACARSSNSASRAAPATSRATSSSGSVSPALRRCRSRPRTSPAASRSRAFSSSSVTPIR